ncbi:hypothetical protein ACOTVJ_05585 [Aliarcobacter butzleri]
METLIILIILVLLVIFYEKIKNKILNIKLKQNDENRKKLDNYISEEK